MSTEQEEIKMVDEINKTMLFKLVKNRYKKHWEELTFKKLYEYLIQETKELEAAIANYENFPSEITRGLLKKECADVANFAGMIHDNTNKTTKKVRKD